MNWIKLVFVCYHYNGVVEYSTPINYTIPIPARSFHQMTMCSVSSNPNDPGPNQELYQRSTLPDRARLKNIEWIPYESVHKKYLSLGETKD